MLHLVGIRIAALAECHINWMKQTFGRKDVNITKPRKTWGQWCHKNSY